MITDCTLWVTGGVGQGKQMAGCSCTGSWVERRALTLMCKSAKSCILPNTCALCRPAAYLCTAGSRSPGCVRGSGRAVVGTPPSHTVLGHYDRCTVYRSQCSKFPLPQSTLLRGRGKWKARWALGSAPQSHLSNDTEWKHEKLTAFSFFNYQRNWCCLFKGRERISEMSEEILSPYSHPTNRKGKNNFLSKKQETKS